MSYASVESQKGQNDLDVAKERSRGGVEVAGVQAGASMYGDDQRLKGTERMAQASEYGADASRYGHELGLQAAQGQTEAFKERTFSDYKGYAKGGLAHARRPYIVGEKGPELMVPGESGVVVPNKKLQEILGRKPIARERGGAVKGDESVAAFVANRGRRHPETYKAELENRRYLDAERAAFFKQQDSPEAVAARAAQEGAETSRFKAQALAMYPGTDGKPDPRASQLIDLYAKTGMHFTSPVSAMEGIDQGMKIHKVVDSWADGKKLAQLQGRVTPAVMDAIKAGNPTAILGAEKLAFGNDHGLDPGVLSGKVKGSTLQEKIGQGGRVTPEMRAKADAANKTGLQHIGGKWLNYNTDANGQRQYQLSPVGNAPVAPKVAGTSVPGTAPGAIDPAMENWRAVGNVVKTVDEAPGNLIEAGLIRPINRAAEGLGSLAVQGARQLIPGAYKVFNEPTPTNPYGLQDAIQPARVPAAPPLAIPIGPAAQPIEEPAPTFYQ